MEQAEEWLTTEEAARRLKVSPYTLRRWLREGQIAGRSINRRAGWRIPESEVRRFLTEGPADPHKTRGAT